MSHGEVTYEAVRTDRLCARIMQSLRVGLPGLAQVFMS